MEKRKIQKIGYSTLSVSLPKDWIVEAGVDRGDFLYLSREEDGSLRILTEALLQEERDPKNFTINLDLVKAPRLLQRLIVGSYMMGAEMITIHSSSRIESSNLEEIREIIARIIGLSIIEETKQKVILTCSIDPLKFNIYSLIRRLSGIAATMFDESIESLQKHELELSEDVIKRENEANAIYRLITRLIFSAQTSFSLAEKMGLQTPTDIPDSWSCAWGLERIADCAERIAEITIDLLSLHETVSKEQLDKVLTLSQMTNDIYHKAVDSLFSGNAIEANNVINNRDKLQSEVGNLLKEDIVPHLRLIATMLDIIAHNSQIIAAITIQREAKKLHKSSRPLQDAQ